LGCFGCEGCTLSEVQKGAFMIYPRTFGDRYVAAWNSKDVDGILSCFDANAEIRSPFAKLYAGAGAVRGTSDVRRFCEETMRRRPKLKFDLLDVLGGDSAVSLYLRDEADRLMIFTALFTPLDRIYLGVLCYNKGLPDTP
jgi:hypothetical protein